MTSIQLGVERLLDDHPLRDALGNARYGLVVNQASVDRELQYSHLRLAAEGPGQLVALFGPQHGLWSEQQDNMVETDHARDPVSGVPVYSLYSETRSPTDEMLTGLDALVLDLQDVGTRVYTYIWTMLYCLRACAQHGIRVVVLDRPNPLGGQVVEGPRLDLAYRSFVGEAAIPMRHGMTVGELARYFVVLEGLDVELDVVPMRGWRRDMLWPDTERIWVPPSPNPPCFEGAVVYPGQVLLEGTQISEGRGTTTPFELCGAEFLDPFASIAALAETWPDALAGLTLRPMRFEPTFQKLVSRSCGGIFVHVRDAATIRSYTFTMALLAHLRAAYGADFAWRQPPYEYERHHLPIDILTGGTALRQAVDSGQPDALSAAIALDDAAWWAEVDDSLLYA